MHRKKQKYSYPPRGRGGRRGWGRGRWGGRGWLEEEGKERHSIIRVLFRKKTEANPRIQKQENAAKVFSH